MFVNLSFDLVQTVNWNSSIPGSIYRTQPEFAILTLEAYMDVGGFIPLV